MNRTKTALLVGTLSLSLFACGKSTPPAPTTSSASLPAPAALPPTEMKIRWTQAPAGALDATDVIKTAYAKEKAEGRTLLVYVGATWCEPCQRFHHAVESHELDAAFPRVSFIAFDSDKDGEALANAGYFSRLIPLIALPNADGKSSGKQIEGGIKGEGAVNDITPRLKQLIAGGS